MHIIGHNQRGQCGIGHFNNLYQITSISNEEIDKIFCGLSQTIFANHDLSKIWSSGWNRYGQCGINDEDHWVIKKLTPVTYFTTNKIQIIKIFKKFG